MSFADFTGSWVIEPERARPLNRAQELISGIRKHALTDLDTRKNRVGCDVEHSLACGPPLCSHVIIAAGSWVRGWSRLDPVA